MSSLTQNKFLNSVMQLSHASGPWFAPRDVRHKAMETAGKVFPVGHTGRWAVNCVFRALHPYQLTRSVIFYTKEYSWWAA